MLQITYYRGVAIMHDPIKDSYYFYPEYTAQARRFKSLMAAKGAIDLTQHTIEEFPV